MRRVRPRLVEIAGSNPILAGSFPCPLCGARTAYERVLPLGVANHVDCEACGEEVQVVRVGERAAKVGRPYGARRQARVDSSNLSDVLEVGSDLVVRFQKHSVYVYPGSAGAFDEVVLGLDGSVGRAFRRFLERGPGYFRKCAVYGCLEPTLDSVQVMCAEHEAVKLRGG